MILVSKTVNTLSDKALQKTIKTKFNSKLFLLLILFSLITKVLFAQCPPLVSGIPANMYSCDAPITLNSYTLAPAGGAFFGGGVTNPVPGTYIFTPSSAVPNLISIIGYTTAPGCTTMIYINIIGSTIVIQPDNVKFTYPSSGVVLNVLNPSSFTGYTWYKNGFIICLGCSTLLVMDMGTYTVRATGPCGGATQDEIEIASDCDYGLGSERRYINHTFDYANGPIYSLYGTGGPSTNDIDYVFGGTIIIPEDVQVNISGANIKMMACTKIIIQKGSKGHNGGILSVNISTFSGCDKWQGVVIEGEISMDNTHPEHGQFRVVDSFRISDAYKAFYAYNGGKLNFGTPVKFENNENDITMRDYSFEYRPVFNTLEIKGKWMHDDIATICGAAPSGYVTPGGTADKKMIYLENVNEFDIENCTFEGNDFLGSGGNFVTNAIELYNVKNVHVQYMNFSGYLKNGIYGSYVTNTIAPLHPFYSYPSNHIFNHYCPTKII